MGTTVAHVELIGAHARVTDAANKSLIGLGGLVVDETRHFLMLMTAKGEKRVPKRASVFEITIAGKSYAVSGDDILVSPEEKFKR